MIRKKTQNHKSTRGPNEKKNEEVTINMVMVVTTRSKALEEVAFQENQSFQRKEPQVWQEEEKFKKLRVNTIQELQKEEESQKLQHEVTIVPNSFWSTKWVGSVSIMEHPKVLLAPITSEVKEEMGRQLLDNKITITSLVLFVSKCKILVFGIVL